MTTPKDPFAIAREIIEHTGRNLFLTGKAGTGKTTFLHSLDASTRKRHVVLAPTGVAAINAGGQTIHSFFQLSFAPYLPGHPSAGSSRNNRFRKEKIRLLRSLDLIIIDEISMVRPDVLDAVDDVLRRYRNPLKPFGGVQLLLIGDLRQLAPVAREDEWRLLSEIYASPYFFESKALREAGMLMIELSKVFRQSDPAFIDILNRIRDNIADDSILEKLNRRADPSLFPSDDEKYIRLTTHNHSADAINDARLASLKTPLFDFDADVSGNFPEASFPAARTLSLRVGAKVMFIKNDVSPAHEYYNGLIGTVISISHNHIKVLPDTPDALPISVEPAVWENMKYTLQPDGSVKEEQDGVFRQYPLRLAWAITIHKSQGLTFGHAIIDAAHSFAPGQAYVALSRCRSLEGMLLSTPLPLSAIMTDSAVSHFISTQPRLAENDPGLEALKDSFFSSLLLELFDFRGIDNDFDTYHRASNDALHLYPKFLNSLEERRAAFRTHIMDVAYRTQAFFSRMLPSMKQPGQLLLINDKIKGGAAYFCKQILEILNLIKITPVDNIDNKADRLRLRNAIEALCESLAFKSDMLETFTTADFSPDLFMQRKAELIASAVPLPKTRKRREKRDVTLIGGENIPSARKGESSARNADSPLSTLSDSTDSGDIENPVLYERLVKWRLREAGTRPAFTVLPNKTLMAISAALPTSAKELQGVKGMGRAKIREFGPAILEIVDYYLKSNPKK